MIRIGMCDDEINTIKSIAKIIETEIIKEDFDAEIAIITNDQSKIYELIKDKKLDVLILDVDFKNNGKNGLDFAHELRKINKDFYLVFLSAFQKYMHISFVNKTFDYLVKPIHPSVITDFISRLKEEFDLDKKIFMHINKSLSIRTDDILYIEKQGNKAMIYTANKTYEIIGSLNYILDLLPRNFKKCHRSYVVNENKIISIDKKNNFLSLENNKTCPINCQFML
jgi:two-component system response regulator AgrA